MLLRSLRRSPWTSEDPETSPRVRTRRLLGREEGARRLALSVHDLLPEAELPHHAVAWEQQVFVLEGSGHLRGAEEVVSLEPGDAVLVPSGEPHQFRAGPEGLRLLCSAPLVGEAESAPTALPDGPGGKIDGP